MKTAVTERDLLWRWYLITVQDSLTQSCICKASNVSISVQSLVCVCVLVESGKSCLNLCVLSAIICFCWSHICLNIVEVAALLGYWRENSGQHHHVGSALHWRKEKNGKRVIFCKWAKFVSLDWISHSRINISILKFTWKQGVKGIIWRHQ